MFDNSILPQNWFSMLLGSFAAVTVLNSIFACCIKQYYRKYPVGRLSHSQLRVKQGNATLEHRINVVGHTLALNFFKPRIYAIALLLWVVLMLSSYFGILSL